MDHWIPFIPIREELAWGGGLFVGEGCFSLNKYKTGAWAPVAVIQMTDLPPLERFQRAVGGLGSISGPHDRGKGHKLAWSWRAQNFEQTQAVMAMLWPWLCPRRRARAAQVLDLALAWNYPDEEVAA